MIRSQMDGACSLNVYNHAAADDLVLTSSRVILEYKSTDQSADWIWYDTYIPGSTRFQVSHLVESVGVCTRY